MLYINRRKLKPKTKVCIYFSQFSFFNADELKAKLNTILFYNRDFKKHYMYVKNGMEIDLATVGFMILILC